VNPRQIMLMPAFKKNAISNIEALEYLQAIFAEANICA